MKISLIAAISENNVIGKDNSLPWHIPEDLKRFKEITSGHPVIMGRKTYESIGRLLPNRVNIIITRDKDYKVEGAVVVHTLDEAIAEASAPHPDLLPQEEKEEVEEVFILGGGQIFEQAMDIADKLYLTIVHTEIEGDVYFPEYSGFSKETYRMESSNEKYKYTFLDLEK